ncbi:MAG: hypothetical protein NZL98_08630, partial [Anaerolineales bacterium]|nr:hypothetical protein [Anaerolineales bacterium]
TGIFESSPDQFKSRRLRLDDQWLSIGKTEGNLFNTALLKVKEVGLVTSKDHMFRFCTRGT